MDYTNNRVLIYNSIPTSNNASADVVLGQTDMASNALYGSGSPTANMFYQNWDFDYSGGKLAVAEYGNNRVLIYNSLPTQNGASANIVVGQSSMTTNTSGTTFLTLKGPAGVTLDSTLNKLLITDGDNHRVLIYNSIPTSNNASADVVIGQADMTHGSSNAGGLSAKSLYYPLSTYVDSQTGKLFVIDQDNNRVLIFNSIPTSNNASADVVIGQPDMSHNTANNGGIGANTLHFPGKVFVYGSKLFISDNYNNRVLIFNSIPTSNNASADVVIGQPDMSHNTANNGGIGANTLYFPASVYTDGTRLSISDGYNNRILIYNTIPTSNGSSANVVIGQTNFTNYSPGVSAAGLNGPSTVQIIDNKLIINEILNDRILFFPLGPQNTSVSASTTLGSTTSTLSLSASDAKDVMVSEDSGFIGASWQSFVTSLPFTLSAGNGIKTIYIKFRDYANYEGGALSSQVTLDTSAPTFSSVSSGTPNTAGATITWTTNEYSSSKIDYGLTNSYGTSTAITDSPIGVKSHSVAISGLSSCTTYHYRVRSENQALNETVDSDNTFTTSGCTGAQGCHDTVTNGVPDLFEIRASKNSVTLYFTPPSILYSNFYIAYSKNKNNWQYGVQFDQNYSGSGGVLSYTINSLQASTKYYFKIRPGNGCATGNYSGIMEVTTTSSHKQKTFYKNIGTAVSQTLKSVFAKIIPVKTSIKTSLPILAPIPASQPKDTIQPVQQTNKDKFCILWWCW
jgi:hypothetical protein